LLIYFGNNFAGGWWYNGCFAISLNGQYFADGTVVGVEGSGIDFCGHTCSWQDHWTSLVEVIMEVSRD